MNLDIIIRTCDRQNVSGDAKKRIIEDTRSEMILKVVDSVVKSANKTHLNTKIKILDDHSSTAFLSDLDNILQNSFHPYEIINLEEYGFNNSAFEQFKAGLDAEGIVYFIEDDYFHAPDAISSMLAFMQDAQNILPFHPVAIYPYDCTHRYWSVDSTKLFYHNMRYWRTVKYSANTLMIHSNVLRTYFPLFEKLAKEYPAENEDTTINMLYNNMVEHGGPITCFSPIPSCAIHMSYDNEAPTVLTNTFTNWKKEWETYEWNK